MAFGTSDQVPPPAGPGGDAELTSVKIVVGGGFGVGKTTFVGSVSEIMPLTTEAVMTAASAEVDDLSAVPDKTTTTVAMDFGRVSLDSELILYLFGTPGQHRFWFMWDDLVRGAIGAVVLVDTRRLEDCFAAVDYFEELGLPFVVGVNGFNGEFPYSNEDIREALSISAHVPILQCDARSRESTKQVLITLVKHAIGMHSAAAGAPPPAAAPQPGPPAGSAGHGGHGGHAGPHHGPSGPVGPGGPHGGRLGTTSPTWT